MSSNNRHNVAVGCFFIVLLASLLSVPFAGCYYASKYSMSDGTRDVTIRKVSTTGIIWKTVELEAVDNTVMPAERFTYTVRDPAVIDKLRAIPIGSKVRLHYRKYATVWVPNGETPYEVVSVDLQP